VAPTAAAAAYIYPMPDCGRLRVTAGVRTGISTPKAFIF
jgi:hypothetical protein